MNFYTLTYDDSRPAKQQVNIPTNSDYKIGIKVFSHKNEGKPNIVMVDAPRIIAEDLNIFPTQVSLVADDGTTISADSEIVNGYVTFSLKSGDNSSFRNYKVKIQNDTFSGILFKEVSGDTGNRAKQVTVSISCDTPTTLYPSDKVVRNSPSDQFAYATTAIAPNDQRFYSYYATIGDDGQPYVSQNSKVLVGEQFSDWKTVEITQEDIDSGKNKISYTASIKGKYHLKLYAIPYENNFDLAINVFKSQQGDLADINFDNTVNIAGTLSDDTEFSYNALMK